MFTELIARSARCTKIKSLDENNTQWPYAYYEYHIKKKEKKSGHSLVAEALALHSGSPGVW